MSSNIKCHTKPKLSFNNASSSPNQFVILVWFSMFNGYILSTKRGIGKIWFCKKISLGILYRVKNYYPLPFHCLSLEIGVNVIWDIPR